MAATWQVTSQTADQFQYPPGANPVSGWLIGFTTGDGWQGSVFIPDTQYTAAVVRAAIQAKANIMDAVGALAQT